MKIHNSIKCITALVGSLAIAATPAEAKPGKGSNKGGSDQSEKANRGKGPEKRPDKGFGKGPGKGSDKRPDHAGRDAGKGAEKGQAARLARFNDHERTEIVEYFGRFRNQGQGLPPGLAMNQERGKPLPPGWQKKLVSGYRIRDDEWASYAAVPSKWFPKMRMEPDTRLYYHGDRVVRVYEPLREVIDVIVLP
ncbi:MAG: hypothetical protein ACNA8L_08800 [Luteolibacter sp.]